MKFSIILLMLVFVQSAKTEVIPYISPGISIQWNSGKSMSAGLKLSIGFYQETYREIDGYILNLTVGNRAVIKSNDPKDFYFYTEIQAGVYVGMLLSGLGIGTAFIKESNKIVVVPKGSVFTGLLAFLKSDIIRYQDEFNYDIGGTLVFPFNKPMFDGGISGWPYTLMK